MGMRLNTMHNYLLFLFFILFDLYFFELTDKFLFLLEVVHRFRVSQQISG